VLVKLGPLDTGRIADLRPYFDSVPDPRARRGRWFSLTAILLVCACAAVSGARSIEELAEWGRRASNAVLTVIGIRRHLLRWRRTPSPAAIGLVLGAVDGDALDRAVGAYLADRHRAATEPARAPSPSASGRPRVIAVDGKALKGSARPTATRRHLLSAVTHGTVVTLAQVEVGAKTPARLYPSAPDSVLRVLLTAAVRGPAYGSGLYGAYGRLATWRSLGGLTGAPADAPIAHVAELVRRVRWFRVDTASVRFYEVAWDLAIVALRSGGQEIAMLAATDTD
jgi:hypothetical protein